MDSDPDPGHDPDLIIEQQIFLQFLVDILPPLDPGHWMDPHILKDPDPGSQNNVDQRIRIIDFNAIFNIAILLYFLLLFHDHNFLNFKPKPSSLVMFYICIQ